MFDKSFRLLFWLYNVILSENGYANYMQEYANKMQITKKCNWCFVSLDKGR